MLILLMCHDFEEIFASHCRKITKKLYHGLRPQISAKTKTREMKFRECSETHVGKDSLQSNLYPKYSRAKGLQSLEKNVLS